MTDRPPTPRPFSLLGDTPSSEAEFGTHAVVSTSP